MTNNDILRRLRFTFNYTDKQLCDLFALADVGVTTEQVVNWLKKDDDKDQVNLPDQKLAAFLNGWIVKNRGKKDGQLPVNEKQLTNNLILNKIKIALSLKADDILSLLKKVDFNLGKAELSAFFRKPDHKHYRQCKDQIVRNLLTALQQHHRPIKASPAGDNAESTVKSQVKSPVKKQTTQGARPNKSKVYVNPNAKAKSTPKSGNTLKLKPEQIWGTTDK
ncbi:DUF1456 family protein [Thalassotalea euphylliae]|uniref:DUF1456 family protein n=1 Tax=Thalassotalea euphylliae TaxID=1655234 RepID=A0A3E0TS29_9GAMM|nr:DUF1456 family protein [Thalassotalea euphylliae]REL26782.1 DUF1456 family protein [Thalassotalea euphylliae]